MMAAASLARVSANHHAGGIIPVHFSTTAHDRNNNAVRPLSWRYKVTSLDFPWRLFIAPDTVKYRPKSVGHVGLAKAILLCAKCEWYTHRQWKKKTLNRSESLARAPLHPSAISGVRATRHNPSDIE